MRIYTFWLIIEMQENEQLQEDWIKSSSKY